MNHKPEPTDTDLALVTSQRLPDGHGTPRVQLDDELQALRDAYLSLGATLETAGARGDEQALIERIRASISAEPLVILKSEKKLTASRRWAPWPLAGESQWPWLAVGSLAASIILALVLLSQQAARDSRATVVPPVAVVVPADKSAVVPEPVLVWDDSLDDELAFAAATLSQMNEGRWGVDDSLSSMTDELAALSLELAGDAL